jgi:hypothetical protein
VEPHAADDSPDLTAWSQQAQLVFVGIVESSDLTSPRAAAVRVVEVLRGPQVLSRLAGQVVTVQVDDDPPAVGETWGFFADGITLGDQVTAHEIGRVPPDALDVAGPHAQPPEPAGSDPVVVGRVLGVTKVDVSPGVTEHDPDWYLATVAVDRVAAGTVSGPEIQVLFSNSLDTAWAASPKLRAAQEATLTLRPTDSTLADVAPYVVTSPGDVGPADPTT